MKSVKLSILLIAASVALLPSQAQNMKNLEFGGLVFNHDIMMAGDFATLSRPQNFGTSRSMAMGGAFTSLGADMASMSLNPAGLGMYRRSEFSITPLITVGHADTPNTQPWSGNNKTRFTMANIGLAFNVYESASKALTSVTIGFGMNRIADFNSRYSYSTESRFDAGANRPALSIADLFVDQLTKGDVYPNPAKDGPNGALDYGNPYFWPAVLGYKGVLTHVNKDTGKWERDAIGHNASMLRSVDVVNAGSINEFDISFGANINNIFYFGATLGIQSVSKRMDVVYGEDYGYFNNTDGYATDQAGVMLPVQLEYSDLWQRTVLDGSGVNFKVGVIARPVAGLRLGVAFHTPTFYSLSRSYRAGIESQLLYNDGTNDTEFSQYETDPQRDNGSNQWEFVSLSRLMFGASYTFGNFAIVSVDYERNWYNGIRVKNVPYGADFAPEEYKMQMKTNFCATNAVRVGVEVKPLPILALRLGGGYTSSMLKDESLAYDMPLTTENYYVTAGAGVNLSRNVTLDLTYQYLVDKQSRYALFYSENRENGVQSGDFVKTTGLFDTSLTRHYISMSLGFRF